MNSFSLASRATALSSIYCRRVPRRSSNSEWSNTIRLPKRLPFSRWRRASRAGWLGCEPTLLLLQDDSKIDDPVRLLISVAGVQYERLESLLDRMENAFPCPLERTAEAESITLISSRSLLLSRRSCEEVWSSPTVWKHSSLFLNRYKFPVFLNVNFTSLALFLEASATAWNRSVRILRQVSAGT